MPNLLVETPVSITPPPAEAGNAFLSIGTTRGAIANAGPTGSGAGRSVRKHKKATTPTPKTPELTRAVNTA